MFRIGIVTVSYHSEAEIRQMLEALGTERDGVELRVVLVSNTGDCDALRQPGVVDVVQSGANIGFGRGNNLGVRHLDTEFVTFCNPDLRLTVPAIRALAQALADNPDFGIVAPFCGDGLHRCQPTGKLIELPGRNVDGCFMMRRDVFNRLNGFDEEFFLWWEDTDLRDRVLKAGLKVGFADQVSGTHAGGHSYASVDADERRFLTRAWISSHTLYLLKHRGVAAALAWLVGMCATNALRLVFGGKVPGRNYNDPPESVRFGTKLLTHLRRLRHAVSYDGQRYGWQG